jgi:N-acetylglucosamine-6-phosphate deacetylase
VAEVRIGCAEALVDGVVVAGDVAVDARSGRIEEVGIAGTGGRGIAVPGLVDLQVNGVGPIDFRNADQGGFSTASMLLASSGATAVQPTFHSQSVDAYRRSLRALDEALADPMPGCRLLPAHLEGPFLSPRWAGAHDPQHLVAPDRSTLEALLGAGPVGFMTLAPELPGAHGLVERLVGSGVTVSIGHTDADAVTVRNALSAGASHLTHCWNAHRRLTARDPGPAGVALSTQGMVVGVVADLVHVAAEVLIMTMRSAPGRVAVTTDSVAHDEAATTDGVVRRPDGTIAGGVARPDDCLRNLVRLGVGLAEAVDACGGVQRRLLRLPEVRLRPGDPADLVVLDDALSPVRTLVDGSVRWSC